MEKLFLKLKQGNNFKNVQEIFWKLNSEVEIFGSNMQGKRWLSSGK